MLRDARRAGTESGPNAGRCRTREDARAVDCRREARSCRREPAADAQRHVAAIERRQTRRDTFQPSTAAANARSSEQRFAAASNLTLGDTSHCLSLAVTSHRRASVRVCMSTLFGNTHELVCTALRSPRYEVLARSRSEIRPVTWFWRRRSQRAAARIAQERRPCGSAASRHVRED